MVKLQYPELEETAITHYLVDPILRCNHNIKNCPRDSLDNHMNCKYSMYRHILARLNNDKYIVVCEVGPINDSGELRNKWANHIVNCLNENLNLIG